MDDLTQDHIEQLPSNGRRDQSSVVKHEFFDRLQRRIEATKAIRFQATVRLIRRHKLSAYVTAMLSLYVIGLSLIPNIFELNPRQSQVLLACTIVMSTFIVVLTLTEGYESFYHKAEVLHESARQLNKLAFKMSQFDTNDKNARDLIEQVSTEYEAIIGNSRVNHAECDYIRIRAKSRSKKLGFRSKELGWSIVGA
jgi:K+-sensing histidine kinase KdpD